MQETFRALVVDQTDCNTRAEIRELTEDDLPPGEVVISTAYSSVNYKDGLAVTGHGKVVRSYPMVPGIDLAGVVASSTVSQWKPGDIVIATGFGLGERHFGGYAQKARVPAEWLVAVPQGMDVQRAMAIGTAGLTAMLSLMELEDRGLRPGGLPVLITGSGGGVGSISTALLSAHGYEVVCSTGRPELTDYLLSLGAKKVIPRLEAPTKPLDTERWAGAIDTVGGHALASLLGAMAYGSSVAACGLAGGNTLATTVLPFILRGVGLLGVDTAQCPMARRQIAWDRLAQELPADALDQMKRVVPLTEVTAVATEILRGKVRGRTVVDVRAE